MRCRSTTVQWLQGSWGGVCPSWPLLVDCCPQPRVFWCRCGLDRPMWSGVVCAGIGAGGAAGAEVCRFVAENVAQPLPQLVVDPPCPRFRVSLQVDVAGVVVTAVLQKRMQFAPAVWLWQIVVAHARGCCAFWQRRAGCLKSSRSAELGLLGVGFLVDATFLLTTRLVKRIPFSKARRWPAWRVLCKTKSSKRVGVEQSNDGSKVSTASKPVG